LIRRTAVPPYCGFPRLSHQLPVREVVVDFVVGTVVDAVRAVGLTTVVDVVVCVCVVVVPGVDVVQDTKTSDVTMRQVSIIQIVPFFILSSCYLMENFWKIDYNLIFRILLKYNNPYLSS
jgi:hypothetical protein